MLFLKKRLMMFTKKLFFLLLLLMLMTRFIHDVAKVIRKIYKHSYLFIYFKKTYQKML